MTPQEKQQLNELLNWKKSLERSATIPLDIDQSFRNRFLSKLNVTHAGTFVTLGGDSNETITGLRGVVGTDIAIVTLKEVGGTPRTIVNARAAADSIEVIFSGDPTTDHEVNYIVIRP